MKLQPRRVVTDSLWGSFWQQQQQEQLQQQQNLTIIRSKHTIKTIKSVAKRFRVKGDGSLRR